MIAGNMGETYRLSGEVVPLYSNMDHSPNSSHAGHALSV